MKEESAILTAMAGALLVCVMLLTASIVLPIGALAPAVMA